MIGVDMTKQVRTLALAFGVLALVGCGASADETTNESSADPSAVEEPQVTDEKMVSEQSEDSSSVLKKANLVAGTYRFFEKGSIDPKCNSDADNKCADALQWKSICEDVSQVMSAAQRSAISYTTFYEKYEPLVHLLENGGSTEPSVTVSDAESAASSCRVSFVISGVYEGTQYRQYIEGYANEIFVAPDQSKVVFSMVAAQ
jgi:hypothetical protein